MEQKKHSSIKKETLIEVLGEIHIGNAYTFTCPKCGNKFKVESDIDIIECFDCAWDDMEIFNELLSPF